VTGNNLAAEPVSMAEQIPLHRLMPVGSRPSSMCI
jgi:hypothetical protein